jgi:hypothetical protein
VGQCNGVECYRYHLTPASVDISALYQTVPHDHLVQRLREYTTDTDSIYGLKFMGSLLAHHAVIHDDFCLRTLFATQFSRAGQLYGVPSHKLVGLKEEGRPNSSHRYYLRVYNRLLLTSHDVDLELSSLMVNSPQWRTYQPRSCNSSLSRSNPIISVVNCSMHNSFTIPELDAVAASNAQATKCKHARSTIISTLNSN